jgi:two-component system nitrogen regulation response regulator NtrX
MMAKPKPRILVVDDEQDIRAALKMILEYEGMVMTEAASGPEAVKLVEEQEPDAVLLDIKMERMDGLEVLAEMRRIRPSLPVIMISGHGTIATAVEATRLGAFDFMEKPLESDRVLLVLRNALKQRRLQEENRSLRVAVEERFRMVGQSPALLNVQQEIVRCAPTRASVLITGESGTGKELVARAIHRNSPRSESEFVKVNCAAIPEELIESELFGHVKGSFTGATRDQTGKFVRADGGTIFLDEIADMSLKTQAKVLRALQDGEVEPVGAAKTLTVDVRVLAATNKSLPDEIAEGRFREDLYFRLNVVPIALPPLRERPEDVEPLVRHFADGFCGEGGFKCRSFTARAIEALKRSPWRGNVRELRNAVERLLIMTQNDPIDAEDIPVGLGTELHAEATAPPEGSLLLPYDGMTLQQFKDHAERCYLVARLEQHEWNVAATSKAIETPRSNLYKKLDAYEISRDGESK